MSILTDEPLAPLGPGGPCGETNTERSQLISKQRVQKGDFNKIYSFSISIFPHSLQLGVAFICQQTKSFLWQSFTLLPQWGLGKLLGDSWNVGMCSRHPAGHPRVAQGTWASKKRQKSAKKGKKSLWDCGYSKRNGQGNKGGMISPCSSPTSLPALLELIQDFLKGSAKKPHCAQHPSTARAVLGTPGGTQVAPEGSQGIPRALIVTYR